MKFKISYETNSLKAISEIHDVIKKWETKDKYSSNSMIDYSIEVNLLNLKRTLKQIV
jgi:hypothetical protein